MTIVSGMIPHMSNSNEQSRHSQSPNQEPLSEKVSGTWPFQRTDGYENPSLERYTDLRFGNERRPHRRWVIAIFVLLAAMILFVFGIFVAVYAEARGDETRNVDAIIVLGAAQYNGRPTDVFEARLQHTLDLYNQGYADWIIVTGGKAEGDMFTEADTAETWLLNRGVPENAILKETVGRDTWQNMTGARDASAPYDIESVLIVSDGFHLFRAERMANAVGFTAYTSPAPDSPIRPWSGGEFSYVIRETVAVIVQIPRWLF